MGIQIIYQYKITNNQVLNYINDINDSESILIDESTIEETIPEIPENTGENN